MESIVNLAILSIGSLLGILGLFAKLRWSKAFLITKDEILRLKDAQLNIKEEAIKNYNSRIASKDAEIALLKTEINNLKDFSPPKLREYYDAVKVGMEEYIMFLQKKISDAEKQIFKKNSEIKKLIGSEHQAQDSLKKIKMEKELIEQEVEILKAKLAEVKENQANAQSIIEYIDRVDPKILAEIKISPQLKSIKLNEQPVRNKFQNSKAPQQLPGSKEYLNEGEDKKISCEKINHVAMQDIPTFLRK